MYWGKQINRDPPVKHPPPNLAEQLKRIQSLEENSRTGAIVTVSLQWLRFVLNCPVPSFTVSSSPQYHSKHTSGIENSSTLLSNDPEYGQSHFPSVKGIWYSEPSVPSKSIPIIPQINSLRSPKFQRPPVLDIRPKTLVLPDINGSQSRRSLSNNSMIDSQDYTPSWQNDSILGECDDSPRSFSSDTASTSTEASLTWRGTPAISASSSLVSLDDICLDDTIQTDFLTHRTSKSDPSIPCGNHNNKYVLYPAVSARSK